ncbi:MAG: hypothetical protein ACRDGK_09780 [Actinomycetota bacterium]
MNTRTKIVIGTAAALVVAGVATGVNAATGDDDTPLVGGDLESASEAAIAHVGGGTVVDSEAGDGPEAYEIEVERSDGNVVEVSLDERFDVIGSEADDDAGEAGESDDDAGDD